MHMHTHTGTHTHTCMHTHTCTHTCMHTLMHACTHSHTHTPTHTHTHTPVSESPEFGKAGVQSTTPHKKSPLSKKRKKGVHINYLDTNFHPYLAGECSARYWCINGSSSATPTDGVTGQACPEGHYCEMGVPVPAPCPLGTWSNSTGLALSGECQACSGGYYCNGTGLTAPSGPCATGYYCTSNAVDPMPNDGGTTGRVVILLQRCGQVLTCGHFYTVGADIGH